MDPFKETKLWPHDNNEVYELYNKIFDCSGHGWSNLQSIHLNLPFASDEEFAKLHTAIRIVLPLLPALCASSPILDEKLSGMLDTRLLYYKTNQARIPSITGSVIPEAVFSYADYQNKIYSQIEKDIAPYNEENILEPVWVNSRGAIARFDRGSIEIRIMDIQECPAADLSIVNVVVELLKALINGNFSSLQEQMKIDTNVLASLLDKVTASGRQTVIDDPSYLAVFGITSPTSVKAVWKHILSIMPGNTIYEQRWQSIIHTILDKGCLSERIISTLHSDPSSERIKTIYQELSVCLAENRMFLL